MGRGNGRVPPAKHSSSAECPPSPITHRRPKKRKRNRETETLNTATGALNLPRPNRSNKYNNRSTLKSSSPYGSRKWLSSSRNCDPFTDRIIFMSYNILGTQNATNHPDLYAKVLPKYLDWNRRKSLLYKEIGCYNADIMCLQEVDRFNEIDALLINDGFVGVHKERTGDSCDGCAIFWKDKLFTLLHQENMEFDKFGLRNNVAQFCVLKIKQRKSRSNIDNQISSAHFPRVLLVGNIHVLFNPRRGDIKLGQMRLFLEKAYELSQEWGKIPVILGGDMNSMPKSAMYKFLASAELDLLLNDRKNICGQIDASESRAFQSNNYHQARNYHMCSSWNSAWRMHSNRWSDEELRNATGSQVTQLQHPLRLQSAYSGVHGNSRTRDRCGEPLATSYHSKFMGTVDYIWHSQGIVPVRVLETLPLDVLRKMGGLPCKKWGSDHLALVCELAFVDDDDDET
ncbi:carbon catabolite repressor protein 4 homolog 5-like [Impatiens glandulifera]|uniref:carbon catabolite repressor protein 4 homolog 5-like n=1 Tax=Impatiens glandulifera TaxID=253017 RepID=UPI001FB0A420|nr:carbon catabolite repressor protein 4 homolog 5-like [Impatiens glandulifera]